MRREWKIITIIKGILGVFKKKDKAEEKRKSDEAKRKMCIRAVESNVCPHTCDICAWNVR